MKIFLLLLCLALAGLPAVAEGVKYYYLETTGPSVKTLVRTFDRSGDSVEMVYRDGDSILSEVICDGNLDQISWTYKNFPEKTDLAFIREKNIIQGSGIFKGKEFARRFEKENVEWVQVFEFCLDSFLKSGKKEKECWTIRPTEMDAYKMVSIREGNEKIQVRQNQMDTVKVRLTVSGPLSIFFSAYYWYRAADLVFVKYEAVRGGPGTPLTVIELIKEEQLP